MNVRSIALISWVALSCVQAATVGDTDRFLPVIQDGGGWSTQVTIVNLSDKQASIIAQFMTAAGSNEVWALKLKASTGTVSGANVEASLKPGAVMVIESDGSAGTMTRGFADVIELLDLPISAVARVVKRENGQVVQSFAVPMCPGNESRSVLMVDLTDAAAGMEMVWVSPTSSTSLDVTFRKETGEVALTAALPFDGKAQLSVTPTDAWPQLTGFRGTMEWKVTFPNADRYEYRFLTGLAILSRDGAAWTAMTGLTLKGDQGKVNPY